MVVKDKSYRLRLHNSMKSLSIKPQNPNWEIVNTLLKVNLFFNVKLNMYYYAILKTKMVAIIKKIITP